MTILSAIRQDFQLNWWGHHGVRHWARVRRNGRVIAQHFEVDLLVLDLFAVLHDSMRVNEDEDPGHGMRAALARHKWQHAISLTRAQEDQLWQALKGHDIAHSTTSDVTVAACWNADRLDLGRVGIVPRPELMMAIALPPHAAWWPLHLNALRENATQRKLYAHARLLPA